MTLLEKLNKVNPALSAAESAEFAGCLLRIMRGLGIDSSLKSLSLDDWIATLKEDGYDVACFIAILQQISISELGAESASSLWQHIKSLMDQPNGAQSLQDYVINHYPKLERRINELHASAEQEENDIEHAAGGLSEKAWVGIGVAAAAGVVYGIRRAIKKGKTPVAAAEKAVEIPDPFEKDRHVEEIMRGLHMRDIQPGQLLNRAKKNQAPHWDDIEGHQKHIEKLLDTFDFHGYAKQQLSELKSNLKWDQWKKKEAEDIRRGINEDKDDRGKQQWEKYFTSDSQIGEWDRKINKIGYNGWGYEENLIRMDGFDKFCEDRFNGRLWAQKVLDDSGRVCQDKINALHNDNPKYVRAQPALDDLRSNATEIEAAVGDIDVTRVERKLERDSSEIAESYNSMINRNSPNVKPFPNMRDSFGDLIRRGSWGLDEVKSEIAEEAEQLGGDVERIVITDTTEIVDAEAGIIEGE